MSARRLIKYLFSFCELHHYTSNFLIKFMHRTRWILLKKMKNVLGWIREFMHSWQFLAWYIVELRLGMFVSHFGHTRINIAIAYPSLNNKKWKKEIPFQGQQFWGNFYCCSVPLQLKTQFYETFLTTFAGDDF